MSPIILEIDSDGNLHGLYTDQIDLFEIGKITNVRKASNVEFNEDLQVWEVISLDGQVLFTHTSREKAIEEEILMFSPGGEYFGS